MTAAWFAANGYGVASVGLAGLLAIATGLSVRSFQRSRVARYARRSSRSGGAAPEEGVALLVGVVEAIEDGQPGAVLWMSLPATSSGGRGPRPRPSIGARPFTLRLPSGTPVRVEPDEGPWAIDTTFTAVDRDGDCVYEAIVEPGDELHVRGLVQQQHDSRAAGTGYRDAARAWVVRGDLLFASVEVIAAHTARARFHARWAALLVSLFVSMQALIVAEASRTWRTGCAPFAALVVVCVGVAYWFASEATVPWVQREVRMRDAWLR